MYKSWAPSIAICDRTDPKNICFMVNNSGGTTISHHALCINIEFCQLRFAIGEADLKNKCVMFNNPRESGISHRVLCIMLGFPDCDL